ncbi:RNA-binding protein 43 isoform X2 [Chaetodon auriga]
MDFPVEATVHLNIFPNETQVREILRSHGFALTDLSGDQVRVKGSFLNLRAVKASLEPLLNSQTKTDIRASSSSPAPKVSSGTISEYYTGNSSDGSRSRLASQNKPPPASPSSPASSSSRVSSSFNDRPTSAENSAAFSPRPAQHVSVKAEKESFVVDADVFEYAERLRKKDVDDILDNHRVQVEVHPAGESCTVTLHGKSARTAGGKLQSLLNKLNMSLRTQEVSLKDLNDEGKALLKRIQKNRDIYNSVLVCLRNDSLHLIGPSGESYKLKQRLLGRPVDRTGWTGRTGQTLDKNARTRSSSVPPVNPKSTGRDSGAAANPAAAGAAGYSASKYQDEKQEAVEPPSGLIRRRTHSASRQRKQVERDNGNMQDTENKHLPPTSPKKGLTQLLKFDTNNVNTTLKFLRK